MLEDHLLDVPGLKPKYQTAYRIKATKQVVKKLVEWKKYNKIEFDKLNTALEYIGTHKRWNHKKYFDYCSGLNGLFELRNSGISIRVFFGHVYEYLVLLRPYKHNSSYSEQNAEMQKADGYRQLLIGMDRKE